MSQSAHRHSTGTDARPPNATADRNRFARFFSNMDRRVLYGTMILLPLLIRIVFLLQFQKSPYFDHPVVDEGTYDETALSIARGSYVMTEPFWQPPLYPFFLGVVYALFGHSFWAAKILQAFLGSGACLFLFLIGRRIVGVIPATIAFLIASFYGPLILADAELLNVNLFIFLQMLMFLLCCGRSLSVLKAAVIGLVFGLAAITVGNLLFTLPLFLGFIWLRQETARRGFLAALVFLCLAALPIGWVTLLNYRFDHELILISSNSGINFYIGNNPDYEQTVAIRPGYRWMELGLEPFQHHILTAGAGSAYFFRKSVRWIASCPWEYVSLLIKKTLLFLSGREVFRNHEIYPLRQYSSLLSMLLWIKGVAFPFGLVAPLSIVGMASFIRQRQQRSATAWLIIGYIALYGASVVLFFVTGRYRLPVVPFLILFAGFVIHRMSQLWRSKSWKNLATMGIAAAALTAAMNLHNGAMSGTFSSETVEALAKAYYIEGRTEEAVAVFRESVALDPDNMFAGIITAGFCLDRNRTDEALAILRRVAAKFPDSSMWRLLHGNRASAFEKAAAKDRMSMLMPAFLELRSIVLWQQKRADCIAQLGLQRWRRGAPELAFMAMQGALAVDPYHANAYYYLGGIRDSMGMRAEAGEYYKKAIELAPRHIEARDRLAALYEESGDLNAARSQWEAILKIDPGNQAATAGLARLNPHNM